MAADASRLLALAEAISDGAAVDWADAESSADPADLELVRELRLLAGLADVARSGGDATTTDGGPVDDLRGSAWGPLTIIERLGAGSFGSVYRARDSRLARDVALKLLHRSTAADDSASSIVEEGRVLARVRHPHVITVFGADRFDDRVGIWMEMIRGRTLEEIVRQDGPLGAREAALIGIDLCSALAAVHAQSIVHRDVKAQNVMREEGGRIVLMDFGAGADAARASERQTGTPAYMAPELFDGEPATPQSDIYSLGVLLFWLVTGEYPVAGRTAAEVKSAHARGERRLLRDVRPELAAEFIAVVERAIEPLRARRFASAGAMEAALRRVGSQDRSADSVVRRTWSRTSMAAIGAGIVAVGLLVYALFTALPATVPRAQETIAVSSLANLSGSDDLRYLAEGVTDVLASRLAAVPSLRVISRASVDALPPGDRTPAGMRRLLQATLSLEGSVQTTGSALRVSVRAVDTSTGTTRWTQTYERPLGSVYALTGEIASAIADGIGAAVDSAVAERLRRRGTSSREAEDAYLRARYLLYSFNRSGVQEARGLLERAVAADPQYAAAHASLARVYVMCLDFGLAPYGGDVEALAIKEAAVAHSLDPDLPEANVALGDTSHRLAHDWPAAEVAYQRASALAPHASTVQSPYSRFLSAAGRPKEALDRALEAEKSDPLSAEMAASVGLAYYYLREYPSALKWMRRSTELNPSYGPGYFGQARSTSALGRYEDAIALVQKALTVVGHNPAYLAEIGRNQALAGWRNAAEQTIGSLLTPKADGSPQTGVENVAYIYIALGDYDRAFEYLDQAMSVNSLKVLYLRVDPRVDAIRQDPRFDALVRRLGQSKDK